MRNGCILFEQSNAHRCERHTLHSIVDLLRGTLHTTNGRDIEPTHLVLFRKPTQVITIFIKRLEILVSQKNICISHMEGGMVWITLDVPKGHMPKGPNILKNFDFYMIIQQELIESSDNALNHYNDSHPLEKISKGVYKTMSPKAMPFFFFILQDN